MLRRPMPWFTRCLFIVLGFAFAAVSCDSDSQAPSTPTAAVPPITTPEVAREGDRHGGFLFSTDPTVRAAAPTTPRPIATIELHEAIPAEHPGYREFATLEELARFVGDRTIVMAPSAPPDGTVLLGGWAVELASGEISHTGVFYRFQDSTSTIGDADIKIFSSGDLGQPLVVPPVTSQASRGQISGPPVITTVLGYPAYYLPFENPRDIPFELQFQSALSWFDDRGWFWSIQGRNMSLDQLQAIAASLMELAPEE